MRKLLKVSLILLMSLFIIAAVSGSMTISAKALTDYDCDSSEWGFGITGIDDPATAPASIQVTWANGKSETVPLDEVTGKRAHYRTTLNMDSVVTEATAEIFDTWEGQFNLSHGPCAPPPTCEAPFHDGVPVIGDWTYDDDSHRSRKITTPILDENNNVCDSKTEVEEEVLVCLNDENVWVAADEWNGEIGSCPGSALGSVDPEGGCVLQQNGTYTVNLITENATIFFMNQEFTESTSVEVPVGSWAWTAIADDGFILEGVTSGTVVIEYCPEPPPPTPTPTPPPPSPPPTGAGSPILVVFIASSVIGAIITISFLIFKNKKKVLQ